MCGALMVIKGGRTTALCKPRGREGEKCKEKPQQGVMKVNGHAYSLPFHGQHNTLTSMKASGELHDTLGSSPRTATGKGWLAVAPQI